LNLLPTIRRRGMDIINPRYTRPKPWDPPLTTFHINALPRPKASGSLGTITNIKEAVQLLVTNPEIATIFTSGSLEQQSGRAGSAFVCGEYVHASRISDHSSILQAELFAIKGALSHALSLSQKCIYILTDSLSAIHALQKFPPANKIHLLTTVLLPGATIG